LKAEVAFRHDRHRAPYLPEVPHFLGRNYQNSLPSMAETQEQLHIFGRNYQPNDRDIGRRKINAPDCA
jgi:hypothetical protein